MRGVCLYRLALVLCPSSNPLCYVEVVKVVAISPMLL